MHNFHFYVFRCNTNRCKYFKELYLNNVRVKYVRFANYFGMEEDTIANYTNYKDNWRYDTYTEVNMETKELRCFYIRIQPLTSQLNTKKYIYIQYLDGNMYLLTENKIDFSYINPYLKIEIKPQFIDHNWYEKEFNLDSAGKRYEIYSNDNSNENSNDNSNENSNDEDIDSL